MKPVLAPALEPGSRIAVIAPAGPVSPEALRRGLVVVKELGWDPVEGAGIDQVAGYLAGEDEIRLRDFQDAINNPRIDAIWFARGGYGSARLLAKLDLSELARSPKVIAGFSDATAMLLGVWTCANLVCFYAPMIAVDFARGLDPRSRESLLQVMTNPVPAGPVDFCNDRVRVISPGVAEGRLIPVCLSVLMSLAGTGYFPDLSGKILCWEEVREAPYRVDRMLTQLRLSGAFDNLAGMVVGQLVECRPEPGDLSFTIDETLERCLGDAPFPVMTGLDFGHGESKQTIPLGTMARLDAGQETLDILEPAVVARRAAGS